jgi:hypothetical protein
MFVVVGHLAVRTRLGNHTIKIGSVAGTGIDAGDSLFDSRRGHFVTKKVIGYAVVQIGGTRRIRRVV